jgi:hypothetical protein
MDGKQTKNERGSDICIQPSTGLREQTAHGGPYFSGFWPPLPLEPTLFTPRMARIALLFGPFRKKMLLERLVGKSAEAVFPTCPLP